MTVKNLLDKREDRIQRMFGQIAPWYDFLNHALSLNFDRRWRSRTAKIAKPSPSNTSPILDLCTGTGDLAFTYERCSSTPIEIIGADFCHEMLVRAQEKSQKAGVSGRISFIQADAQALPFPDKTFQLLSCAFGLRNITNTSLGITEMYRVLEPGGQLAILECSRPRQKFLRWIYTIYFRHVLPKIGQLLSRNGENAYRYLPESVLAFPDYDALAAILGKHGFIDVRYIPFTLGAVTLYLGRKPIAANLTETT